MTANTREDGRAKADQESIPRDIDPENIKIGYIGGGSRLWGLKLINDLAQTPRLGGEVALYDIDSEGAERNERFGNWVQEREETVGDWTYTAVEHREDALSDADFVLFSTQYPTSEAFKYDLEIPKSYGIYQTVAVTIGPGGIIRAMRTIPVYRELAAAIREHCPNAWVLNYTNPLTFLTRTLYEEYPDINALGLCHEVFHLQDFFTSLVSEHYDVEEPPRSEIDLNVKGINHFTWADEAWWKGHDLRPLMNDHLAKDGVVREYTPDEMADESGFVDNNQVTYELYKRFGVLPAAGDRHLVEYAPWFLQGEMPDDLLRWGVKRTTSEYRVSRWKDEADQIERYLSGEDEFELFDSGEMIVDILQALSGGKSVTTNVNLPNKGQIQDVPKEAVVETNALFTQNDVKPVVAGRLPRPIHTQVMTHIHTQETVIEAAFAEYDVDHAFQGFLNDPQVKTLQIETAQDLFADLIAAERKYFEKWDLENSNVLEESSNITL